MYIHTPTSNLHTFSQRFSIIVQPLNQPFDTLRRIDQSPFIHTHLPKNLSSANDDISPVIREDLAAERSTIATTADQSGGAVSQFTVGDASGEGVLFGGHIISPHASASGSALHGAIGVTGREGENGEELTSLQRPRVAPPLERKGAHLPGPLFRHTSLFLGRA